jgi:hypothetical protein
MLGKLEIQVWLPATQDNQSMAFGLFVRVLRSKPLGNPGLRIYVSAEIKAFAVYIVVKIFLFYILFA